VLFSKEILNRARQSTNYTPSYAIGHVLKLNRLILSKTTLCSTVVVGDNCLNLQGVLYSNSHFFDPPEGNVKVNNILERFKSIQRTGFEKVRLDAEQLNRDTIRETEAATSQHMPELKYPELNRITVTHS